MRHIPWIVVAIAMLSMTASTPVATQEAIWIANFPDVQQVTGTVALDGPIPEARIERFENAVVTSVPRSDTNRLVAAGTLDATGYTTMVLSLGVQVKGTVPKPCEIGAVLVPDEELVTDAFTEGHLLFPVEVTADLPQEAPQFVGSDSEVVPVAFPRYRVFFYNTGSRTVKATLFAMLRSE